MLGRRRAISPVVTETILLAVTIVVSLAVSAWLIGISMQSIMFETIEIMTIYNVLETNVTNAHWRIVLDVKNTGSDASTIREVLVNGVPVNAYGISSGGSLPNTLCTATSVSSSGLTLMSGEVATIYVWIGGDLLSSGTSCEVNLHSEFGVDYLRLVKLI